MNPVRSLRILAVADLWFGSDGYSYVRAFRRLGHSVRVVPPDGFIPTKLGRRALRALRRCLEPALVREYNRALVAAGAEHRPDLFFVYKGRYIQPETVRVLRALGAIAVNVYPDVSVLAHGRYLPRTLPEYDWIFHTKQYGVADLERLLGIRHASHFPHAYDPDVHRPVALDEADRAAYACDVSFIGTWSPKKAQLLESLRRALPAVRLRVWGGQWQRSRAALNGSIEGRKVEGLEYAKALLASRVNIAILSEVRKGASSGDQTTARTFQVPATGAFMLHERTAELLQFFDEGKECACFGSAEELVEKTRYFLAHDDHRRAIAAAGCSRVRGDGHSVDGRVGEILAKLVCMRSLRA